MISVPAARAVLLSAVPAQEGGAAVLLLRLAAAEERVCAGQTQLGRPHLQCDAHLLHHLHRSGTLLLLSSSLLLCSSSLSLFLCVDVCVQKTNQDASEKLAQEKRIQRQRQREEEMKNALEEARAAEQVCLSSLSLSSLSPLAC